MRNVMSIGSLAAVAATLAMMPPDAGGPGGVMSTAPRVDAGEWPEGDLPEQFGGDFTTLLPGVDLFELPKNLAQLCEPKDMEDKRPGSPTFGQKVKRWMWKFDKKNPLIIIAGPRSGDVLTGTISTHPIPRGKKDDPSTPWVSAAAYLLEIGLANKSRPVGDAIVAAINQYAGHSVLIDHGLSGQCNPERVVRLYMGEDTVATPPRPIFGEAADGRKGCGARYRMKDFKNPAPTSKDDVWFDTVQCTGHYIVQTPTGPVQQNCQAIVRGFPSIERFLPSVVAK